jgi:hypothetical protein
MQAARIPDATATPRRRRAWWTIAVVALLLLAYAIALAWATRRLEADVQRSLHPLPAVQHDARADD